jgi:hypothetical protein
MRTPSSRNADSTLPHLWPTGSSGVLVPRDYGPVLLLMPFGFHPTVNTLPSESWGRKFPPELKLNARGPFTGCYNSQFRSRIVQLPDLRTEGMTAEEAIFVRSQTLNGAEAR